MTYKPTVIDNSWRRGIAERLTEIRDRGLGQSQLELSITLGVSQSTVSQYETGKVLPSLERLLDYAQLGGVSTDYILRGLGSPPRPKDA